MPFQPVELAQEFIRVPSVTDDSNAGVADCMADRLEEMAFQVIKQPYQDRYGTTKIRLDAIRRPLSDSSPHTPDSRPVAFFCHNDVVSVSGWDCPHGGPFEGTINDERLWGRGSCDMKGPTAAAFSAISRLPHDRQSAPIYVFITGDEENGMIGAQDVSRSELFQELVSNQGVGVICEPTELEIVHSHKGGCHFDVVAHGVAAHSSTTKGRNANWQLIPFLSYLQEVQTRCLADPALNNPSFSPSDLSMNLILENEPAATNITVGKSICRVFLRPMPETSWQDVMREVASQATALGLEIHEYPVLPPLYTDPGREFVQTTLRLSQTKNPLSVCFATDGCFLTQLPDLVVVGPGSIEQAHRSDEFIRLDQLTLGSNFYESLVKHYAFS